MTIIVNFLVKPEHVATFKEASLENAKGSIQEPGNRGFDVYQQQDDLTKFAFVENFLTPEDHAKHRETAHYILWKSIIMDILAEPYTAVRFDKLQG